jgi:hypothetical protein
VGAKPRKKPTRPFTALIDYLRRVPAIDESIGSGVDGSLWWVKLSIDTADPLAWRVVQELGHVLNYIFLGERLPTAFYPVSPPPYLNGGVEFLSWLIESTAADFSPADCAEWLEGRLPRPVEDDEAWELERATEDEIDEFWAWFVVNADELAIVDGIDDEMVDEIDERVDVLAEGLTWELGPGLQSKHMFVIGPGNEREQLRESRRIIARAPALEGWEFYPAKPPKNWGGTFKIEVGGEHRDVDVSGWRAVLLRYPDGYVELHIEAPDLEDVPDTDRFTVAVTAVDSAIGEERRLEALDGISVVPRFEQERFASAGSFFETAMKLVTRH